MSNTFRYAVASLVAAASAVSITCGSAIAQPPLAADRWVVKSTNGPGQGGLDNEVEWDVTQIQSGVYFAHIDAQGTNGSGSAVIKIAVIK